MSKNLKVYPRVLFSRYLLFVFLFICICDWFVKFIGILQLLNYLLVILDQDIFKFLETILETSLGTQPIEFLYIVLHRSSRVET